MAPQTVRILLLYIHNRLRYVSLTKRLGTDWPHPQLELDFTAKAEGLFLWVATVTDYLCTITYPKKKLATLLYERNTGSLRAESKMDDLYAEILIGCNWDDEDFVDGYHLVVGAIMVARTPLSINALQSLHRTHPTLDITEILRPLASLFTGLADPSRQVQTIHLSSRDFLTHRAQSSHLHQHFYINKKEHSQRLALLCLMVMNEDLQAAIPGTGYLTGQMAATEGIPSIKKSDVSEVLWYACRFWGEHIIDVEAPVSETLLDGLRIFFSAHLAVWMEVLISNFQFQSLDNVRAWLLVRILPATLVIIS
jgi:hypothetical protein